MKKGIVALILIAAIPFFVHAYVSPGKPTGFVNDFANIIPSDQKIILETTLSNYKKQSGNEIAIVTVPSLGDEEVQGYAVALFKEWGIGEKGKDNGLLILHAPNERKVWIEVGYGLEPYITDAKSGLIYRNILTPAFRANEFVRGYTEAVMAVIGTLNGQVDAVPKDVPADSTDFLTWLYAGVFLFIYIGAILGRTKSWWLGGVIGGIAGVVIGFFFTSLIVGSISFIFLAIFGLIFDFSISKMYASSVMRGMQPPWWIGGGHRGSGGFGGGFGGFGGGGSGGGGGGGGY